MVNVAEGIGDGIEPAVTEQQQCVHRDTNRYCRKRGQVLTASL